MLISEADLQLVYQNPFAHSPNPYFHGVVLSDSSEPLGTASCPSNVFTTDLAAMQVLGKVITPRGQGRKHVA